MQVEAKAGAVVVRLGSRFATADAERLSEMLVVFAPVARLTMEFHRVREFEDAAIFALVDALRSLRGAELRLCGLMRHQATMLRYFGLPEADAEPVAAAEAG